MGTYATIFPENVGLMVLDANSDPGNDIVSDAEDLARFKSQRIDYFIASCEFSSECHVPNMRGCINQLNRLFDANPDDISALFNRYLGSMAIGLGGVMTSVIYLLYGAYGEVGSICDAAAGGDYDQVKAIIKDMLQPTSGDLALLQITQDDDELEDSESKPTSGEDNVWPFGGYNSPWTGKTAIALVSGQDYAFGAYDEDLYVRSMLEWRDKYSGAGTRPGATDVYRATYYFPNVTPLAPIGNPQVGGIIAGQIYDPKTPYVWTQKMRERFPLASLLTSRSVNHGMESSRPHETEDWRYPVCQGHIQRYFKTGVVDIVDGHVCESEPIGDSCTINAILAGGLCHNKAKRGGGSSVNISSE